MMRVLLGLSGRVIADGSRDLMVSAPPWPHPPTCSPQASLQTINRDSDCCHHAHITRRR